MNNYDKGLQAPYNDHARHELLVERFEAEARDRWGNGDSEWIYTCLDDNEVRDLLVTVWSAWVHRRPTAIADSVAIDSEVYDTIDSAFEAAIKAAAADVGVKDALTHDPDDDKPHWMDDD